jgi:hypothetical protein
MEVKTLQYVEDFTNESDKKIKLCVYCGNVATHTACFSVEHATVIERYCDTCVKNIRST